MKTRVFFRSAGARRPTLPVSLSLSLLVVAHGVAWGQSMGLVAPAVTGQFSPLPTPVERAPVMPHTSPAPLPKPPETPLAAATPLAPPAPLVPEPQGCRPISERALAVDLKAVTAQSQKHPLAEQIALYTEAIALWTKAIAQCEGRPKDRAQRNLVDNQRAKDQLSEQQGSGAQCENAHRDAGALQELARKALFERRFAESAVLFRKAEDAWDDAAELCTGSQQELADKRRDESALDGHNAEFCAPVYGQALAQTQKLRGMPPNAVREDKHDQSLVAETLWRNAMAKCKGPAAEASRTTAQSLARERGTPWVARAAPVVADPVAPPRRAAAALAAVTTAGTGTSSPKPANTTAADLAKTSGLLETGSSTLAAPPAAPAAKPGLPQPQPPEFSAGTTRFSGKFERDADSNTFSGVGQVTWPNGDVYDGTLSKGLRQGKGLFIWANGQRFEGDWVQDTPSGKGKLQFANGNRFEGDVVAGIPQGMGRMQYASGDEYSGRFYAGLPEGRGAYRWKDGQNFDGEWKAERPNGTGTLKFANGNVFEGQVVNGVPHGHGTLRFATGEQYTGTLVQGEPDGQGSFVWTHGDQYTGQWKAGKKHGQGAFTWKSGERWEGVYENDVQK